MIEVVIKVETEVKQANKIEKKRNSLEGKKRICTSTFLLDTTTAIDNSDYISIEIFDASNGETKKKKPRNPNITSLEKLIFMYKC